MAWDGQLPNSPLRCLPLPHFWHLGLQLGGLLLWGCSWEGSFSGAAGGRATSLSCGTICSVQMSLSCSFLMLGASGRCLPSVRGSRGSACSRALSLSLGLLVLRTLCARASLWSPSSQALAVLPARKGEARGESSKCWPLAGSGTLGLPRDPLVPELGSLPFQDSGLSFCSQHMAQSHCPQLSLVSEGGQWVPFSQGGFLEPCYTHPPGPTWPDAHQCFGSSCPFSSTLLQGCSMRLCRRSEQPWPPPKGTRKVLRPASSRLQTVLVSWGKGMCMRISVPSSVC